MQITRFDTHDDKVARAVGQCTGLGRMTGWVSKVCAEGFHFHITLDMERAWIAPTPCDGTCRPEQGAMRVNVEDVTLDTKQEAALAAAKDGKLADSAALEKVLEHQLQERFGV